MAISTGNKRVVTAALVSSILLLAGCGGGPMLDETAQANGTASAPTQTVAHQASVARADTDSFTLNSTASFKGFNPQDWNGQKSWYECDCGNKSRPQPKTMPWNPA